MSDIKNVKKAFIPLIVFLQANSKKNIATVMDEILAMVAPKQRGATAGVSKTFIRDAAGDVVAVFDYYFKRWMPLVGDESVEFGVKANSATGLNSMCKEGVSFWTAQQRAAKSAIAKLLADVEAGTLAVEHIGEARAEIDTAKDVIEDTDLGFADMEGLLQYLADTGVEMPEAAAPEGPGDSEQTEETAEA